MDPFKWAEASKYFSELLVYCCKMWSQCSLYYLYLHFYSTWPYHSSDGYSATFGHGGLGSIPGQSMWMEWNLGRFSSMHFSFPCQLSFHQGSTCQSSSSSSLPSPWTVTTGPWIYSIKVFGLIICL